MAGSLSPIGGYKGASLALLVDILAAGLSGSHFSFEASSFGDCEGGPPRTGQLVIAFDPGAFGGAAFVARTENLFAALQAEPRVRLPGERRLQARQGNENGIEVPVELWELIGRYADQGSPVAHKGGAQ
jgi:(2R)-3-sulfolactate dehydrogenase (NADP+)